MKSDSELVATVLDWKSLELYFLYWLILKLSLWIKIFFVLTLNRNTGQGCSWIWKYNHRHHHQSLFVHGSDNIIHEFSSSSNWYFPPVFLSPEEKQQITTTKLERCSSRQKLLQSNLNEKGGKEVLKKGQFPSKFALKIVAKVSCQASLSPQDTKTVDTVLNRDQ